MGMSATQARYLSLVAQQSNLEYQGQQINQERAILSQQVSDLYNSLLNLAVPTPPSTQDYTKVVYQGTVGATNYSFDASKVKPGSNGSFSVSLGTTEYGQSLQKNKGYAITDGGTEKVIGTTLSHTTTTSKTNGALEIDRTYDPGEKPNDYNRPFVTNFYKFEGEDNPRQIAKADVETLLAEGKEIYIDIDIDENGENELVKLSNAGEIPDGYKEQFYLYDDGSGIDNWDNTCMVVTADTTEETSDTKVTSNDLDNLYVINNDGTLRKADINDLDAVSGQDGVYTLKSGLNYFKKQAGGDETYNLPVTSNEGETYTIAGKNAMTLDYARENGYINETEYNGYLNAINNAGLTSADGTKYTANDYYMYIDDNDQVHFALKHDVQDGNGACATYDYIPDGKFTKETAYDQCKLTFDPETGRITKIEIPIMDANGNVTGYTGMDLEAATETDKVAYEEAMAKYEYDQLLYDKEQAKINAETEKIQQMDRNLELKLQRLDTQRTQITTEMEALDKVMNDNIESSYKTFSG